MCHSATLTEMARSKQTAARYLATHDQEMRVILGEMIQNAAKANVHWDAAERSIGVDPERALEHLADAWVVLKTIIRIERTDALRVVERTMALLDTELPDDDDHSSDPT